MNFSTLLFQLTARGIPGFLVLALLLAAAAQERTQELSLQMRILVAYVLAKVPVSKRAAQAPVLHQVVSKTFIRLTNTAITKAE